MRLQLFREDEYHARTWLGFVGPVSEDLNYLHRQAKKLVEFYCDSHPGYSFYHSDEREYVAECRGKIVNFGVSIRDCP